MGTTTKAFNFSPQAPMTPGTVTPEGSMLPVFAILVLQTTPVAQAQSTGDYADPISVASVSSSSLTESSGLASSRNNSRIWWTHNDSGDSARVFAFDLRGNLLGISTVSGASFTDWEDMAAGPCPVSSGDCLYIADIGDNSATRDHVTVYAFPEPRPGRTARVERTWNFRYPEGPHNAETMLVHPLTGDIYIVTKESDGHSGVYRVPDEAASSTATAIKVGDIDFSTESSWDLTATGGDWSWDGTRVAIRTYGSIWEWSTDPDSPDSHWDDDPVIWDAASEAQGEALGYSRRGDIFTTSEGTPMPVSMMRRLD